MVFAKIEQGVVAAYPYTGWTQDFPHVSFPAQPSVADLAPFDVVPVEYSEPPAVTWQERLIETVARDADGVWRIHWQVETLSDGEMELAVEQQWAVVRADRTRRLAASDWVVIRATELSEPVPAAWLEYRQALRDVTEQRDPFTIDWPTPPA